MQEFKEVIYKIIGDRIKTKRKEQGLSQEDLSKHLKVGRSSISNIEIGRHQVPLYVLYEIASLLKFEIYDIIPTYEDVIKSLNSNINEYSKILQAQNLSGDQRESVESIIKAIGKNDN